MFYRQEEMLEWLSKFQLRSKYVAMKKKITTTSATIIIPLGKKIQ